MESEEEEEDYREEVHEEQGMTSTYSSFTDRTRTERWGMEETRRFFEGLRQCGTDFTLMLTQFPGRTQKQLKNKFKKESKENKTLVDQALNPKIAKPLNCTAYTAAFGSEVAPTTAPPPSSSLKTSVEDSSSSSSSAEASSSSSSSSTQQQGVVGESTVFDQTNDEAEDLVDV